MTTTRVFASLLICLFSSFTVPVLATETNDCVRVLAAFDVGSASTKLKVARVDTCQQLILKHLYDASKKVNYKVDLEISENSTFSKEIMAKGVAALRTLKSAAEKYNPDSYTGVATSAFRKASNRETIISEIERVTNIALTVLDAREEGIMGFKADAAMTGAPVNKVLVWDIGGGSMQLTMQTDNGSLYVYSSDVASVGFKNIIIKNIQEKELATSSTPNPISIQDGARAVEFARHLAWIVPTPISSKIGRGDTLVVGIGEVHYYSIRAQLGAEKSYTRKAVHETLKNRLGLTDEQIDSKYASTEISNLALVSGYMEALDIDAVIPAKLNLADGLLLHAKYWKK